MSGEWTLMVNERAPHDFWGLLQMAGASLGVGALAFLLWVSPTHAQTDGPPPLPIVYQGAVYVDGVALAEDAELTVRVGDWESTPAPARNGEYINLIVGPPNLDYIGEEVSFHLDGLVAEQRLIFPSLGEPRFELLRLDFTSLEGEGPLQEETPTDVAQPDGDGGGFPWVPVVGGALGGVALLVALVALRPGRARRSRAARRRER